MSGVLRTVGVLMIQFRSWTMEITAELKFGATVCENGGHVASVCISTFTFGSPVWADAFEASGVAAADHEELYKGREWLTRPLACGGDRLPSARNLFCAN